MTSKSALLVGAVAVLGVAAGLGISRLAAVDGAAPQLPAGAGTVVPAGSSAAAGDAYLEQLPAPGPPVALADATDPRATLEGFLFEEANGDFAASFGFLSSADRAEFGSPAAWAQAHGMFWPITAYRIDSVTTDGDGATAEVVAGYDAGLDPVLGLVPARGDTVWKLVREADGWRVAVGKSTREARYPPDEGAASVAERWAEAQEACVNADEWQVERSLVGTPALAERLCDAGTVQLGAVEELREIDDVKGLVAAYGPDVLGWARVVYVESPERIGIVLAPIGADWRVMGVIGPGVGR